MQRKILILTLSAASPPHLENELCQRATWASNSNGRIAILWLRGGAQVAHVDSSRTLWTTTTEEFSSIFEKTIESLGWALEHEEFDYVLRTNTSSYVDVHLLLKEINRAPDSGLLQGPTHWWRSPDYLAGRPRPFVGGYSILMSSDVARELAKADSRTWMGLPDDVAISEHLTQSGVQIRHHETASMTFFDPVWPSYHTRLKDYSRPDYARARMESVHRIYTSEAPEEIRSAVDDLDRAERHRAQVTLRNRPDRILRFRRHLKSTRDFRVEAFEQEILASRAR